MNRLEEIQTTITEFNIEKQKINQEIQIIEQKRIKLAQERNDKKRKIKKIDAIYVPNVETEINKLGKKIAELGNQSQELQNKLNYKCIEVREKVNIQMDNQVTEKIREIYKLEDIEKDLKEANEVNKTETEKVIIKIEEIQQKLIELAKGKKEFKKGNWSVILESNNNNIEKEKNIEEVALIEKLEKCQPKVETSEESIVLEEKSEIDNLMQMEIKIEEFIPIEQPDVETFKPIKEIKTIKEIKDLEFEEFEKAEEIKIEEFELLKENNKEQENDIIVLEELDTEPEKVPNVKNIKLLSIIAKIENGELIYRGQTNSEKVINIYPTREKGSKIILKDKEIRRKIKENLINYAVSKYKMLDKKVIKKIDLMVCEVMTEFAEQNNYKSEDLIYNYAMTFSKNYAIEVEEMPQIIYNFSFIEDAQLNKKEKTIISKIYKNAKNNDEIEIIERNTRISKIKYLIKRLFGINNIKALPEGRYI